MASPFPNASNTFYQRLLPKSVISPFWSFPQIRENGHLLLTDYDFASLQVKSQLMKKISIMFLLYAVKNWFLMIDFLSAEQFLPESAPLENIASPKLSFLRNLRYLIDLYWSLVLASTVSLVPN